MFQEHANMEIIKIFFIWILNYFIQMDAKNILFIPYQLSAYIEIQQGVLEVLVQRGHNVTILIKPKFVKLIKDPDVKIIMISENDDKHDFSWLLNDLVNKGTRLDSFFSQFLLAEKGFEAIANDCDAMLNDQELLNSINRSHIDIAYVNAVPLFPCFLLLPYNLSIPFIMELPSVMSFFPWINGFPGLPSFIPVSMYKCNNFNRMDFIERVINTFLYAFIKIATRSSNFHISLLHKYAPGMHSWNNLIQQSFLYVSFKEHVFDWPQPQMPNMIYVPNLSYHKSKRLPRHIDIIYEKAKDGIVLVAFGSILNSISHSNIKRIFETFDLLKELTFIMSYKGNNSKLVTKSCCNVHNFEWLPQNDILGHPKTILFITHCGYRSLLEALYHGVKIICLSFTREQAANAHTVKQRGYGTGVNFYDFTAQELYNAINEVMNNPKYTDNVNHASRILNDLPNHPTEILSDSIEHVAKFGADHLQSYSMKMSLFEFLMLDIVCLLILVALSFIIAVYFILTYVIILTMFLFENLCEKYFNFTI